MAISRNTMVGFGLGAVALGAAFSLGLFSSGSADTPAGISDADSPVVTVYKSPT